MMFGIMALVLGLGVYFVRLSNLETNFNLYLFQIPSLLHGCAFVLFLSAFDFRMRDFIASAFICVVIGASLEYFQLLNNPLYPGTFDQLDLVFMIVGVFLGLFALAVTNSRVA